MKGNDHSDITNFCVAGINYKKTDASMRGQFAIGADQYHAVLDVAPAYGLHEIFILSTCNRTEIYGITDNVQHLVQAICTQTAGNAATFNNLAYVKRGPEAVEHLFDVAAGLDSQILGDYEIIGQIKQSVKAAREKGFIGATLNRMVNAVLQSSKAIKNHTALSGGTVSVSFAAVQYIKEKISHPAGKKIVLVGTGKIGRNTCKNIVDYLGTTNITLINRTPEKAAALAKELGLHHAPLSDLSEQIAQSDIILVATNAAEPTILASQLAGHSPKLIIDLSIPYNVEAAAQQLANVTLVNVDDLSKLKDKTLQKRQGEIPKAKAIIATHAAEFTEWYNMRKHVPVLKAVKDKLEQIHFCQIGTGAYIATPLVNVSADKPEARIQKIITTMAVKMRLRNQRGCQYIEAINDFMATGTN
ncbi:MAG: glutamyl-tRNA reductase [Chitinophagaceae bacterium]